MKVCDTIVLILATDIPIMKLQERFFTDVSLPAIIAIIAKYVITIREWPLLLSRHCWGVYERNSVVNSVLVDDWTTE